MDVIKAITWCLAVGGSFVGYGLALQCVLRRPKRTWLTSAGTGIGVITAFLGIMNLLGWIRPIPLFVLVVLGNLALILLWRQVQNSSPELVPSPRPNWATKPIAWLALAWVGCTVLAGLHSNIVNYFDDPQAYFAYPIEALQAGSLQPQPFSERRINTSLGANYLLDAVLIVHSDVRGMGFLDESVGFLLYAAAIWAIAGQLGLVFETKGLLLTLLLLLPLIASNVAPTFLQAGLALVLLLVMQETAECRTADWRSGVLWGVLASVLCFTKSSGIVFVFPLLAIFAIAHSIRKRGIGQIKNAVVAGATILVLALPWMIQQRSNTGTYLSPVLGRGFHASHWGTVPLPAKTAAASAIVIVALPNVMALLLAAFLAWKVRSRSRSWDISLVSFMLAAAAATLFIAFGTGGEAIDRFSFPFHIPSLLLFAILLLAMKPEGAAVRWHRAAVTMLAIWIAAIVILLGAHYHYYRPSIHRLKGAAGIKPTLAYWELELDNDNLISEEKRAHLAQSTVPPGEHILEATLFAYPYDFRRNKVLVADYPGLAGWAPGIPIGQGPGPVRDYLVNHDIHYFICDRRLTHNNEDIADFLGDPILHFTLHDVLRHHIHDISPWGRMEWTVSRDVRHNMLLLADDNKNRLYDDGTLVVVQLTNKHLVP